jgi:hypothetical protein
MRRVGTADVAIESAANDDLLRKHGLTPERTAEVACELLRR